MSDIGTILEAIVTIFFTMVILVGLGVTWAYINEKTKRRK